MRMKLKYGNPELKVGFILLLFSFIFMFFTTQCSPLYIYNEWIDPNVYFTMGKGAMNGHVLYRDLFDHKGPLIFFVYGFGYLISDTNLVGIYILESLVLFVNLIFAYKISKIFLDRKLAFVLSLLYAVLFSHKTETGGSAEEFITPAIIISFYYFILYYRRVDNNARQISKQLFIHGIMFSIAFLIKFTACAFWIPLLFPIFYDFFRNKQYKGMLVGTFYFILGFMVLTAPILLYFLINSALSDFFFTYFEFNLLYGGSSVKYMLMNLIKRFSKSLVYDYIFFFFISFGTFVSLFSKKYIKNRIYRISMLLSFLLSYLSVSAAPNYMNYGYIILCVFGIIGFVFILELIDKNRVKKIKTRSCYAISFIMILAVGVFNKKLFNKDWYRRLGRRDISIFGKWKKDFIWEQTQLNFTDASRAMKIVMNIYQN